MARVINWRWETKPEKVFVPGMKLYQQAALNALRLLALSYKPRIEAWLIQNAKWTDRTGNLRQSLYAEVEDLVMGVAIALDYGLEYGVFLAYANQGAYDIVGPALDKFSAEIWADVEQLFSP